WGTINSVEELLDSRAKEIADLYELDFEKIVSSYQALEKRVVAGGGDIEIDLNISPEEKEELLTQLASGAVICYEYTKRKKLSFPSSNTSKRTASKEVYEQIGNVYNTLLEKIGLL
ncbi:MAG: hypothetical protein KAU95_02600, partial [Candidatus Aenigmarchaeota archaeon]|nr:hypothetical protein [Candidatus Aenigmarchaeota archaeon]